MTDKYIDPNSGAAPQPGGYAHTPVEVPAEEQSDSEPRDAAYDAAIEHEAAPLNDQPQNDGETANEAGQTDEDETTDGGAPAEEESTDEAGDDEAGDDEAADEGEEKQDYSELLDQSLGPIQKYLDEHPGEAEAIKAAEIDRAGDDARKGVIEYGD